MKNTKRKVYLVLAAALVFCCVGCGAKANDMYPKNGQYFLVGDFEEQLTPYLYLNTEEKSFMMGAGTVVSFAEYGTFEIKNNKLIATSQTTTFIFEIRDENTLILVDTGDNAYFKLPKDGKFIYSEN